MTPNQQIVQFYLNLPPIELTMNNLCYIISIVQKHYGEFNENTRTSFVQSKALLLNLGICRTMLDFVWKKFNSYVLGNLSVKVFRIKAWRTFNIVFIDEIYRQGRMTDILCHISYIYTRCSAIRCFNIRYFSVVI